MNQELADKRPGHRPQVDSAHAHIPKTDTLPRGVAAEPSPGRPMKLHHWLALIPFLLFLCGAPFAARVQPFVFGLPFFLAWTIGSVLATAAVMWLVFRLDPANGAP